MCLTPHGNQRIQNAMCRLSAAVTMNFYVLGPFILGPFILELSATDDHFFTLSPTPAAKKNASYPMLIE
jgi:hypothetical protein